MGTLNDNIAEYLSKTNSVATTYFVWGNIGGLYPSWAWGTLLCSTDNTANFIGIANSDKTAAFAHYENGTWEKVPVESLSNLTTTNKSSLVDAINEVNSNTNRIYEDIGRFVSVSADVNTIFDAMNDESISIKRYSGESANTPESASGIIITFKDVLSFGWNIAICNGKVYSRNIVNGNNGNWVLLS